MKKRRIALLCVMTILLFSGCGGEMPVPEARTETEVPEEVLRQEPLEEADTPPVIPMAKIDVDLTALSSTMVYSEVYAMTTFPEEYRGKTVKMEGDYVSFHDDSTGKDYFACVISDATACCSQGIEFVLTEDYVFPDDYPAPGDTVCVVGEFSTYEEAGNTYCTLLDATLIP